MSHIARVTLERPSAAFRDFFWLLMSSYAGGSFNRTEVLLRLDKPRT
jgi:hypothetical protein